MRKVGHRRKPTNNTTKNHVCIAPAGFSPLLLLCARINTLVPKCVCNHVIKSRRAHRVLLKGKCTQPPRQRLRSVVVAVVACFGLVRRVLHKTCRLTVAVVQTRARQGQPASFFHPLLSNSALPARSPSTFLLADRAHTLSSAHTQTRTCTHCTSNA